MPSPQKHQVIDLDPFIASPTAPHPPIKISVKNQDTVTWEASQDFAVVNIEKENDPALPPIPAKPPNPFFRLLPFQARAGADGKFRANSGPAVSGASKQHYKTTFEVLSTGAIIDPDFIVDP
jgi:hypothetical protein